MRKQLIPPKLAWPEIWSRAEVFRETYVTPIELIPVPIEEIIEFKLRVEIRPVLGLKNSAGTEGLLLNDLKAILVDKDGYFDIRFENRLRFTLAHEVGHLMLHATEIQQMKFRNQKDYIEHRLGLDEECLDWFERQASEFAGRLLVPKVPLLAAIESEKDRIQLYRESSENCDEDLLLRSISRAICNPFGVSDKVIQRRIRSEKISF